MKIKYDPDIEYDDEDFENYIVYNTNYYKLVQFVYLNKKRVLVCLKKVNAKRPTWHVFEFTSRKTLKSFKTIAKKVNSKAEMKLETWKKNAKNQNVLAKLTNQGIITKLRF